MRRASFLAIALALCATTAPVRASASYVEYDAMVPMSDGVHLDASLYVPVQPSAARVPLIVRQHGGGSNKDSAFDKSYGLVGVERGDFALLMYSARGHGNSEGLFDFFGPRTTKDFSEMLDWVAATHGDVVDTNDVGASGYSQGGGESLLPAEQDARVKALAVGNTFDDLNHALNPNDCFKASFATGIFAAAYTASATKVDETLPARWGAQLYSDTEDVGADPAVPSTTEDLRARSPLTYVKALIDRRVPVFWTQGWEDQLFPGDMPEQILRPLERAGVPVHYWFNSGGHGATDYVPEQQAREAAMLDWFDQFLRGVDHGFATGPKVDVWERTGGAARGPGTWVHSTMAEWPAHTDAWTPAPGDELLYAQGDGSPGSDGTLGASAGTVADPTLLVSPGAHSDAGDDAVLGIAAADAGQPDALRPVPDGPDRLRYVSAPLAADAHIVGTPSIRVSYDRANGADGDMQLDPKVWDVAPEGTETLIARGCDSEYDDAGYRVGYQRAFYLWPNATTVAAGHRIALTLSASDAPTFEPSRTPVVALMHQIELRLPVLS